MPIVSLRELREEAQRSAAHAQFFGASGNGFFASVQQEQQQQQQQQSGPEPSVKAEQPYRPGKQPQEQKKEQRQQGPHPMNLAQQQLMQMQM